MSFGLIINHNLGSMNALAALSQNQNAISKVLQQLSTGKRINSAADDAAGLAISEKMQAQINGLHQASQNAQDGISLIQTAEGALNETASILQRMRQLAVQAANDTNTASDRTAIQEEISQLNSEIDRIANSTTFNTKTLLNGSLSTVTTASQGSVGTKTNLTLSDGTNPAGTNLTAAELQKAVASTQGGASTQSGVYQVQITHFATQAQIVGAAAYTAPANGGTISINGVQISIAAGDSETTVITKINNVSSQTGVIAKDNGGKLELDSIAYGGSATISLTGSGGSANGILNDIGLTNAAGTTTMSAAGTDAIGRINGVSATAIGNTLILNQSGNPADGLQVTLANGAQISGGDTLTFTVAVNTNNVLNLQIGANPTTQETLQVNINNMSSTALGVNAVDVTTTAGATQAISMIDNAISKVSQERAKLGAYQNRLEHTINNLNTASQNLTASESAITDTDMASAMAEFTKDNILQQAAISMLAQANQQPQLVLKLLG